VSTDDVDPIVELATKVDILLALQRKEHLPVVYLTIPEAAEVLRVSKSFVYELVQRDEIPVKRYGKRELVPFHALELLAEEAITEWQARHPGAPP
jgi:excisionase family DNA binding protein